MKIGLLWFDNGEKRSLKEKISNAVSVITRNVLVINLRCVICILTP